MNPEKYKELLNTKKFECICFGKDYIDKIIKIQNEVSIEDYAEIMARIYDEAYKNGQCDSLEKITTYAFLELDDLYQK